MDFLDFKIKRNREFRLIMCLYWLYFFSSFNFFA